MYPFIEAQKTGPGEGTGRKPSSALIATGAALGSRAIARRVAKITMGHTALRITPAG